MSDTQTVRLRVLDVDKDSPKKTSKQKDYWRARCEWVLNGQTASRWISCFDPVEAGMVYDAQVAPWTDRGGATQYSARSCKPIGAAAQPTTPSPATAQGPPSLNQPGYSAAAYLKLDDVIGKQLGDYEGETDEFKGKVYACMWIAMSKDPVVMGEMEKRAKEKGEEPEKGCEPNELPPDETIPF